MKLKINLISLRILRFNLSLIKEIKSNIPLIFLIKNKSKLLLQRLIVLINQIKFILLIVIEIKKINFVDKYSKNEDENKSSSS